MARKDRSRRPSAPQVPLDEPIEISTGTAVVTQETDGSYLLEVNGVPSSHLHPDAEHLVFEYLRWMKIAIDLWAEENDVDMAQREIAHLGGAGCALPRALAASHPGLRQIVAEIDGVLAEKVRTWFDLPRSPQLRIRVEDAAQALASWRDSRYAALTRDVFAGSVTPDSLTSLQAAEHAHRVLQPGGLYLANSAAPPGTRVLADEIATLREVFTHVDVIGEPAHLNGKRRGNCVLIASSAPLPRGLDRALRSDAVSVRLAGARQVESLRRGGRVLDSGSDAPTPVSPAPTGSADVSSGERLRWS